MTKPSPAEKTLQDLRHLSADTLSTARAELDAVVKATDAAAHTIMEAAEKITALCQKAPTELAAALGKEVGRIFESCTFQDITGQRVSNVRSAIHEIEQALGGNLPQRKPEIKKAGGPIDEASLMNGPQLKQPTQDDVDKLFDSL